MWYQHGLSRTPDRLAACTRVNVDRGERWRPPGARKRSAYSSARAIAARKRRCGPPIWPEWSRLCPKETFPLLLPKTVLVAFGLVATDYGVPRCGELRAASKTRPSAPSTSPTSAFSSPVAQVRSRRSPYQQLVRRDGLLNNANASTVQFSALALRGRVLDPAADTKVRCPKEKPP